MTKETKSKAFALRLTPTHMAKIDRLARAEPDRPTDAEVIRRLIERAPEPGEKSRDLPPSGKKA